MGRARELANLFSGGSADINVKTSDGGILNLQTSDTTVTQDSVVGSIQFQAPDEASGTDSILVASKIEAVAEGTFSASSNATSLVFSTASSAAAGTVAGKMTFTSGGELVIKDTDTADGSSPTITLQSGDTDIAQDDVLGTINFQAPDEGTGTDAILVAAGIAAVSEGDFSSSSNATKLVFKTGSSEAASEKMSLSSAGLLTVADDIVIGDGKTIGSSSDPDAIAIGSDGDVTLTQDLELQHDGATISFGANDDIQLIHVHNEGVTLKAVDTGGNSGLGPVLNLSTGDTDIAAGNQLGAINFQAPDEGTGTDAILVGASITAIAQDAFSSSVNSTSLLMRTSTSGTNDGGYLELTPTGNVNIRNQNSADDSFPTLTLQTGDTDIAQNDVLGKISFQAPNEGAGTDAVVAGASIQALSEGDFSSSNNATTLSFLTAASGSATSKMTLDSVCRLLLPTNVYYRAVLANRMSLSGSAETQVTDITEDIDVGGNASGGTFTCPIAGKYLATFSGSFRTDGASYVDANIKQNTGYRGRSYSELGNAAEVRGANAWHPFCSVALMDCSKDDTIKFFFGAGTGASQLLESPYTVMQVILVG